MSSRGSGNNPRGARGRGAAMRGKNRGAGYRRPITSNARSASVPNLDRTLDNPPRRQLADGNCRGSKGRGGGGRRQRDGNQEANSCQASGQSGDRVIHPIGSRRLEELLNKDPSEVLLTLKLENNGFFMLLNSASHIRTDLMALVLKALGTICNSDYRQNMAEFLNKVISLAPNFLTLQVTNFLVQLKMIEGPKEDNILCLAHLLGFLKQTHRSVPNASFTSLMVVVTFLKTTLEKLKWAKSENTAYFEDLLIETNELSEELEEFCKQNQRTEEERNKVIASEKHQLRTPPNNFREIPIFPQKEDIHLEDDLFLRRNVVEGKYIDVDHYLDVQFRLLREDFIRPLREGIHEYLHSLNTKHVMSNHIRLYTDVRIKTSSIGINGIRHRISFSVEKLKHVRWEGSKRLLTGSLLCLSADRFETMLFATVANRKVEDLREGLLEIQFEKIDTQTLDSLPFIMVESEAYFEAFRHNLVALQSIHEDNFPLKQYIVDVDTNIRRPSYVSPDIVTLFQRIKKTRGNVYPPDWLSDKIESFDDSQTAAFEAALTKELAIIQGPPGTGKTFIGLKIVEALLSDCKYWIGDRIPILLVCYTNHALDQFLEGISQYTDSIARIGGRCQNEDLDQFTLRSIKQKKKDDKRISAHVHRNIQASWSKLKMLSQKVHRTELDVVRISNSVMSLGELQAFMLPEHASQFKLAERSLSSQGISNVIHEWLALPTVQSIPDNVIQKMLLKMERFYQNLYEVKISFARHNFAKHENTVETLVNMLYPLIAFDLDEGDDIPLPLNMRMENKTFARNLDILVENFLGKRFTSSLDVKIPKRFYNKVNSKVHDLFDKVQEVKDRLEESANTTILIEELEDILLPMLSSQFKFVRDYFDLDNLLDIKSANSDDSGQSQHGDSDDDKSEVDEDIEYEEDMRNIDEDEDDERLEYDVHRLAAVRSSVLVSQCQDGWQVQGGTKKLKAYLESQLRNTDAMSEQEACFVDNVWALNNIMERWRLYRYWVRKFLAGKNQYLVETQNEYLEEVKVYQELRKEEDFDAIRDVQIVAMTTTGAAKYRFLINKLNPRVLIVEEAAEVLEAHIVTSLTKDIKHVILIGDHQQLRPSAVVYQLAKKFNLEVSLFERMIANGMAYYPLVLQHRMKPCISSLLTPSIYAKLMDHTSVMRYERIKGVEKDMFFLTHSHPEETERDGRSYKNPHEAEFVVQLCNYFILQGYMQSQITILTTYSGQLFLIKQLLKRLPQCNGVRATVVDNFQGEENDIILLSFVRSNEQGNPGFLNIENRVCVALSRAKWGMFCIGNFVELLANASPLWKKIVSCLREKNAIGFKLTLQCQNHPQKKTLVCKASDILSNSPEGGCNEPCEFRMPCGHVCPSLCHLYDIEHKKYKCRKKCLKVLCPSEGHRCQKECHFETQCPPCSILVPKSLSCGHVVMHQCHKSENDIACSKPCEKSLACGHKCKEVCRRPCTKFCTAPVTVRAVCGHQVEVECANVEDQMSILKRCQAPCRAMLSCIHRCRGSCGSCYQKRMHVPCKEKCGRILVCGHTCSATCSEGCPPCSRRCENRCTHGKCQNLCGAFCVPCKERCTWRCKHAECTNLCCEPCNRLPCDEPCEEELECGHKCIGLCGEPCPTKCRICHKEEVTKIFLGNEDEPDARFIQLEDCKHVIEVEGLTHWLQQEPEEGGASIQLKQCPHCKTPIRKNVRYGNVIRESLDNIEKVKQKICGSTMEVEEKRREILNKLNVHLPGGKSLTVESNIRLYLRHKLGLAEIAFDLKNLLDQSLNPELTISKLISFENFLSFLDRLLDIVNVINEHNLDRQMITRTADGSAYSCEIANEVSDCSAEMGFIRARINEIKNFLSAHLKVLSGQQLADVNAEITRLEYMILAVEWKIKIPSVKRILFTTKGKKFYQEAINSVANLSPFGEKDKELFKAYLKEAQKVFDTHIPGLGIDEIERKQILKAMNLKRGHWYTCPNGHVYCITECGGAMVESRCNECGARIGGGRHRLRDDNRVATVMDGATFSAWSEQAHMMNYQFED